MNRMKNERLAYLNASTVATGSLIDEVMQALNAEREYADKWKDAWKSDYRDREEQADRITKLEAECLAWDETLDVASCPLRGRGPPSRSKPAAAGCAHASSTHGFVVDGTLGPV